MDFIFGKQYSEKNSNFIGKCAPAWRATLASFKIPSPNSHVRDSTRSLLAKARRAEQSVDCTAVVSAEQSFSVSTVGLVLLLYWYLASSKHKITDQNKLNVFALLSILVDKFFKGLHVKAEVGSSAFEIKDAVLCLVPMRNSQRAAGSPAILKLASCFGDGVGLADWIKVLAEDFAVARRTTAWRGHVMRCMGELAVLFGLVVETTKHGAMWHSCGTRLYRTLLKASVVQLFTFLFGLGPRGASKSSGPCPSPPAYRLIFAVANIVHAWVVFRAL
jgi:hypothetical protein